MHCKIIATNNGVKLMLLIEIGLRLIRFLLWGVRLWELKQMVPYGICVNTDRLARKLEKLEKLKV